LYGYATQAIKNQIGVLYYLVNKGSIKYLNCKRKAQATFIKLKYDAYINCSNPCREKNKGIPENFFCPSALLPSAFYRAQKVDNAIASK